MKKLLVFLLTLLCLASFTACDPNNSSEPPKPTPEVKPEPEVKPTPEVQGKLMNEALSIVGEVMNNLEKNPEAYGDKVEFRMSETEMFVNLMEPITLASGVEVSSLKTTGVMSETTGLEQTLKMTWVSKVDNAKHDLTMSMKATPDEMIDPNFEPKANVILDGNSFEFDPNAEVKPDVKPEPEVKPTATALLDEVMQAGDELFTLAESDHTLIDQTFSEDATSQHDSVTLKKPVTLPGCGVRLDKMEVNMVMSEATGIEETIKMTWLSKLDNAVHSLDMAINATPEEINNPEFVPTLKGTVDGSYVEYKVPVGGPSVEVEGPLCK